MKTYGTPERINIKSVRNVEEAFHAQMCEAAEEQCGKGDAEACRTACEDCGIEEVCAPAEAKLAATWRKFPDHKSETRAVKEALKKAGIEAEVKYGWDSMAVILMYLRRRPGTARKRRRGIALR